MESNKNHTFLKLSHFDNILQFCLESSYCTFNNEFYKQTSATAANVVMEELEIFFFLNYLMISYFITYMKDIINLDAVQA